MVINWQYYRSIGNISCIPHLEMNRFLGPAALQAYSSWGPGIKKLWLLTAFSHAGLVDKGQELFESCMSSHYRVTPAHEHYTTFG